MADVSIVEVSPTDGLQNQRALLSTAAKVKLIGQLVNAGATRIEAVSFAHPRLVFAIDAEAVINGVRRVPGVPYVDLVLDRRGLDHAVASCVDEVNFVVGVSDAVSRNQNASTREVMQAAVDVVEAVRDRGTFTTITLATVRVPGRGRGSPGRVVNLAVEAARCGVDEIALADTVGIGIPAQERSLIDATAHCRLPPRPPRLPGSGVAAACQHIPVPSGGERCH
ncbi:MAG: hypothetical protein ACLPXZ_05440 [Mycobacterium sp.]